ncbi:hypothetical protein D9M73_217010 [compost metagenome]
MPRVLAERLQLIELAVVTGFQHAAVTDHRRRVVDDGFFQQCRQLRIGAGGGCQLVEVWRFQLGHCRLQLRQRAEGIPQASEVSWAGVTQADPGENALDVADFLELRLQLFETVAVQQASD